VRRVKAIPRPGQRQHDGTLTVRGAAFAGDVVRGAQDHYERLPEDIRAEIPLQPIWTLVPDGDEAWFRKYECNYACAAAGRLSAHPDGS